MRGIVTLATAFGLPSGADGGPAFPFRVLILLCALTVVAGTLVVQGLTLRPLILWLGLEDDGAIATEVRSAQAELARVASQIIEEDGSVAANTLRAEFAMPAETEAARTRLRARIIAAQR